MSKTFHRALVIGRFQPFHKGHQLLIDKALEQSEEVIVLIGSSQEANTERNPFSFQQRKQMIEKIYSSNVNVLPLPDIGIGDCPKWGEYLLDKAGEVDLFVSGEEEKYKMWFSPSILSHLSILTIDKEEIHASGTEVRKALLQGDRETFESMMDPKLYPLYEEMRAVMKKVSSFS